jgi:hypothetical protein
MESHEKVMEFVEKVMENFGVLYKFSITRIRLTQMCDVQQYLWIMLC